MRWIVGSSVRLAVVVVVVVALSLAGGVVLLGRAPVDTLPELLPPQVQVQTDAIGLSSHEVEQFLVVPAEGELANVAYLDHLTSRSVPGMSSILLSFKPGTSVWNARQLVAERMAQVPLPVDVGTPPVLIQPLSSSSRAMMVGLSSTAVAPIDLTTLAKWRIRPRLLAVPGVANVTIWGQKDREMLVLLDPVRMSRTEVTLDQVMASVGDSMWTSPLTFVAASTPGADGVIDTPNQRLTIQHVLPIISSKDLVNVPIEGTGVRRVSVGDVSTVIEDHSLLIGDAVLKKGPGLILVVEKLPGADALAVDRGVESAMGELEPGLSGITIDTSLFRPGTYLADSLRSIGIAGLIALLAVCAWLGVAYRSWRVALSAGISIAASLLAASLVLLAAGLTFNVAILTGLVMALGVIVDDVVVAASALKYHPAREGETSVGLTPSESVAETLLSARTSLGFAFAVLVLVSVPFFFVPGIAGTLSMQLIIAYLAALVASAAVAAVVTPALVFILLPASAPQAAGAENRFAYRTQKGVRFAEKRPGLVALVVAAVVLVGIAGAVLSLPRSFVPSLRDGGLVVHWQAASGTSLDEMKRITARAEQPIRALPGVLSVTSHVGQALSGDQIVGSDAAETWISLGPKVEYGQTVREVNRILSAFPGLRHTVESYADSAVRRAATDSSTDVNVRVYGSNIDGLNSAAAQVRRAIATIPGVAGTSVTTSTTQPLIQITTDIGKAARYGLKPGDVRRQTAALMSGIPVGSYYQDQQVFEVAVWGGPALRQNPKSVENLPIFASDGARIPLKTVASVAFVPEPSIVDHDKASRFLDIKLAVSGAGASSVTAAVKQRMRSLALPLGYHTEVSSPLGERKRAETDLALIAMAVVIGILLLLQAALQSWRKAALVLVLMPFAVSGSVLAAAIFGWGMTIGVVAGVVTVLGLALRNATLLIRRFEDAGEYPRAREELRVVATVTADSALPIVASAVATALAVSPFVILGNVSGIEILKPFAVVVLFGLVTSTVLTLLVLPALYRPWGISRSRRTDIEGAQ